MTKTEIDSWVDRHWKSILGVVVACLTAYYTLEAKTMQKADKTEVAGLLQSIQELKREVVGLREDLHNVMVYICSDAEQAKAIGCQQYKRGD